MLWTTSDLITSIKLRGQFPDTTNNNNISSNANLLILATEELRVKLLPTIMRAMKEFYVYRFDIAVVAGQDAYPLPTRATGNVLRSIRLVSGSSDLPFQALERDILPTLPASQPIGYFFENNSIVLFPAPAASVNGQTIRTRFYIRPSRLEQVANCAQITGISGNVLTVNAVPSSWSTSSTLDLISQTVPYACTAIDQTVTNVTSTTITLTNTPPSQVAVNDYVALAEYTPLPQIPEEWQPVLSQMVVCKVLEATGDRQGLAVAKADLKEITENVLDLVTPRDASHPEKIVGTNWRRLQVIRGFLR